MHGNSESTNRQPSLNPSSDGPTRGRQALAFRFVMPDMRRAVPATPFGAVKPYFRLMVRQQEIHHDLSLAWFDCLKRMTRIYREGSQNGDDAMRILDSCAAPSTNLMDAFSAFLNRQSEAVGHFCTAWTERAEGAGISAEPGRIPE